LKAKPEIRFRAPMLTIQAFSLNRGIVRLDAGTLVPNPNKFQPIEVAGGFKE
jgi:hypothetical protein